jgi:hypothetical protein
VVPRPALAFEDGGVVVLFAEAKALGAFAPTVSVYDGDPLAEFTSRSAWWRRRPTASRLLDDLFQGVRVPG